MGNKESILELIYKAKKFKGNLSEQELLYWMKKGVELKLDMAYLPLSMYYQEKEDYKNLELFLEKSYYVDKNLQMGCNLSSYYLNLMNNQLDNTDFSKAYDIASQIVDKNPSHKQVYICYSNLSYMYEKGDYLAKDLKKAIDIRKKSSEVSENFAKVGDLEYIEEKELELKNSLKLFEKLDKKDEKVFPIINNFTKKEQVIAALETKKYFFKC
jgi:TPR repeat protein